MTLGAIVTAATGILGAVYPVAGTGLTAEVPFVAAGNYQTAYELKLCLTFGDRVKNLLGENRSAQDIQTYLQQIRLKEQNRRQKEKRELYN